MMKRFLAVALMALLLCAPVARAWGAWDQGMDLRPAQLSDGERQLLKLTGFDGRIYRYRADGDLRSVEINCYKLGADGAWIAMGGGGRCALEDAEGRLALSFDDLSEGLRVALEGGNGLFAFDHEIPAAGADDGLGREIRWAGDLPIEYEQEMPLAVQLFSDPEETAYCEAGDFERPQAFLEAGYEKVYALTLTFSRQAME